jgi:hypothetical protein
MRTSEDSYSGLRSWEEYEPNSQRYALSGARSRRRKQMEPHPYRQAYETQDLERLLSLLADDVIFHSPIFTEPGFEGRDSTAAILAISLDLFKDMQYTHDLGDEHSHVLVGDVRVLGKPVKITMLLEFERDGKIREIWIMIRPLTGLVAVTQAIGEAVERAGRGSEVRELSESLAEPAAEVERAAAGVVRDLNRATADPSGA